MISNVMENKGRAGEISRAVSTSSFPAIFHKPSDLHREIQLRKNNPVSWYPATDVHCADHGLQRPLGGGR